MTKVYPAWDQITLQSPPVHCITQGTGLTPSISGSWMQAARRCRNWKTQLISDVDRPRCCRAKPLVVGPFYNKNPEVFKPDGTVDYSNTAQCPAV